MDKMPLYVYIYIYSTLDVFAMIFLGSEACKLITLVAIATF